MKILIPSRNVVNPFLTQFVNALRVRPEVEIVDLGLEFLDQPVNYDVVIIQWPEGLINFKAATEQTYGYVEALLNRWKAAGVKIVATVHNVRPHRRLSTHSQQLYDLIYGQSDSIVHLGETSKRLLKNEVNYEINPLQEVVIPHGNYNMFIGLTDEPKINYRSALSIPRTKKVILVLGQIRKDKELDLLFKLSRAAKKMSATVLLAGRMPYNNKRVLSYYTCRLKVKVRKNIRFIEGTFTDGEVKGLLEASDIVFVPRLDALNSGNVALGFTFGKVVLGPDFGVIGEELRRNGNPTFDVSSHGAPTQSNLDRALQDALSELDTHLGKKNYDYSQISLGWDYIAQRYIEVIQSIRK